MTCRVARLSSDLALRTMDLVFSCDCGSSDLEVCYTSKNLRAACVPNLHPVQGRVRNMGENSGGIVDERAACRLSRRRCTQVNLKHEQQRNRRRIYALSSLPRAASF